MPRFSNKDRMFIVSRQRAIHGDDSPVICKHLYFRSPCIDHRLDRDNHAGDQPRIRAGRHIVWYLRIFMNFKPNAVSAILPYNAVPLGCRMTENRSGNIKDSGSRLDGCNALFKGFAGNPHELIRRW